jgi:hypothetical protein
MEFVFLLLAVICFGLYAFKIREVAIFDLLGVGLFFAFLGALVAAWPGS